jgi:predicted NBD/HSP70 family sugar kinase
MESSKATTSQLRRHNRQLVLRAVYNDRADNRAALAQETGLTKPTVSDLVAELMDEGLLVETELGHSTLSGGKRPRLLKFVPDARQVIGVSINGNHIRGVLTNLDGSVIAEHYADLPDNHEEGVIGILSEVINGLVAQTSAPLLCLGVGISAVVDAARGVVNYAPHLDWHDVPLADLLAERHAVPVYVSNSRELAALAQLAFGSVPNNANLATVLVGNSVGVGLALEGYHSGSEIGHLSLSSHAAERDNGLHPLENFLGWRAVRRRALALGRAYDSRYLQSEDLTYLNIRYAIANQDRAALELRDELTFYLAQVFAWIIAFLRPTHLSLAGAIADLGEEFLDCVIQKTRERVLPDLVRPVAFSVDNTSNLVALGAAAKAVRQELGLV